MLKVFNPLAPTPKPRREVEGGSLRGTGVKLAFVIRPADCEAYIEWPVGEPMENVIAMMLQVERGSKGVWQVVFDPEDDDLLEVLVGGYRLHGMFVEDMI